MAKLQSGNLGGGITHTFEFDYRDLQNPGFLSKAGELTGSAFNTDKTYGADNQKLIAQCPRGGAITLAGITIVEPAAGLASIDFLCDTSGDSAHSLPDTTSNTETTLCASFSFEVASQGGTIINNGGSFTQDLDEFLTGDASGLNGTDVGAVTLVSSGATYAREGSTNKIKITKSSHGLSNGDLVSLHGLTAASGSSYEPDIATVVSDVTTNDFQVVIPGLDAVPTGTIQYFHGNFAYVGAQLNAKKNRDVYQKSGFNPLRPGVSDNNDIFIQLNPSAGFSALTSGRWIIYFTIIDTLSLLDGPKPEAYLR